MLSRTTDILLPLVETPQIASSDSSELSTRRSAFDGEDSSASQTDSLSFDVSLPRSPLLSEASSHSLDQQRSRRQPFRQSNVDRRASMMSDSSLGKKSASQSQPFKPQPRSRPLSNTVTTLAASSSTLFTRPSTGIRPRSPLKARVSILPSFHTSILDFLSGGSRKRRSQDVEENSRFASEERHKKRVRKNERGQGVESVQRLPTWENSRSSLKDEPKDGTRCSMSGRISMGSHGISCEDVAVNANSDSELEEGEIREGQFENAQLSSLTSAAPSQTNLEAPLPQTSYLDSSYLEALRNYRSPSPPTTTILRRSSSLQVATQQQREPHPLPRKPSFAPPTTGSIEFDATANQAVPEQRTKKKRKRNKKKRENQDTSEEVLAAKEKNEIQNEESKPKLSKGQKKRKARRKLKRAAELARAAESDPGEKELVSSTLPKDDAEGTATCRSPSVVIPLVNSKDNIQVESLDQPYSRHSDLTVSEKDFSVAQKSPGIPNDNSSFEASILALRGNFSDEENQSDVEEPQNLSQINLSSKDQPSTTPSTKIDSDLQNSSFPLAQSPDSSRQSHKSLPSPTIETSRGITSSKSPFLPLPSAVETLSEVDFSPNKPLARPSDTPPLANLSIAAYRQDRETPASTKTISTQEESTEIQEGGKLTRSSGTEPGFDSTSATTARVSSALEDEEGLNYSAPFEERREGRTTNSTVGTAEVESSELSDIEEGVEREGDSADSGVSKKEDEMTPVSLPKNSRSIHLDQAVEKELKISSSLEWLDVSASAAIQALVADRDNVFSAQGRSCSPDKAAKALEMITSSKTSLGDKTALRYLDYFAEYLAFCYLAQVSPFPITVDLAILYLYQHRIQNPNKPRRDRLRALRCFARCTISIFHANPDEYEYQPWKEKREMTKELEDAVSTPLSDQSSSPEPESSTLHQRSRAQDNRASSSSPSSPPFSVEPESTASVDRRTAPQQTASTPSQSNSFPAQPGASLAPSISARDPFYTASRLLVDQRPLNPSLALNNPPPRELIAFLSSFDPSLRSLSPFLHHAGYSTLYSLVELALLAPSTRQRLYIGIKLREEVDSSLFDVLEKNLAEAKNSGWVRDS
ncbi:hypothetical protein JCM5350_001465 [Sporobolomyces pararoseus]